MARPPAKPIEHLDRASQQVEVPRAAFAEAAALPWPELVTMAKAAGWRTRTTSDFGWCAAEHALLRQGFDRMAGLPVVLVQRVVTMGGLHFDHETHTFWRAGVRVLSVTQVLERCRLTSPWWTKEARDRGTRVHQALYRLQHMSDREAREDLWPGDAPYYEAGTRALDTFGIDILAAEELVDGGAYAGWLDLRCRLRGQALPFVIDFKTGKAAAWTPLQLAAYAAPQAEPHGRAYLELQPSGVPKLTICREHRGDLRHFNACVTVAQLQLALEIPDVD